MRLGASIGRESYVFQKGDLQRTMEKYERW